MADYTETQLSALRAAIAAGVTEVSHEGTTTRYRSLDEMERIATIIERDLNGDEERVRTRIIRFSSTKDL